MKINNIFWIGMIAVFTGCTDYQEELDALDYRVTYLEELVNQINTELAGIKTITDAVSKGDFITNVTENEEGYIITFKEHGAVQIKHGATGKDGKDAEAPEITVEQDGDGNWYWKLNGKWLTDDIGNRIRSNGTDGKDGKDGKAVAPQVRINSNGNWEISPDGGTTWNDTGTAASGVDGKDGNTLVKSIEVITTLSGNYVHITLTSGATFDIPMN